MTINKFISKTYEIDYQLPLTLMLLNDWSFITAKGNDAKKYLQSQLTTDIFALSSKQHVFTAHCNAKGKMWSTLHLFYYKEGFGYVLRASVAKKQLSELKKYAIFSQITIKQQSDIILLGIAGQGARDALNKYFYQLPDHEKQIIHFKKTTLLYFNLPSERFLIITDNTTTIKLIKYFKEYSDSQQWLALDISAGFANIDIENSGLFIPQAVNLDTLPGSISFNKGCYSGQEIIARTKYRNANKRSIFWLLGIANKLPKIGEPIELQVGNNWRHIGTILAAVKLTNTTISIQVIMNYDVLKESVFRLLGEEQSKLIIKRFPYSLVKE
ncbi:MAG: tRNA-modifying protein YgfZ [Arsenophonus sp. ET-YP4-MAG3]